MKYLILFFTIFTNLSVFKINICLLIFCVISVPNFIMKRDKLLKDLLFPLFCLTGYFLMILLSSIINLQFDNHFIKLITIEIIKIFNIYYLVKVCSEKSLKNNFILDAFTNILIFQMILSIFFKAFPSIGIYINSLLINDVTFNSIVNNALNDRGESRLIGIGYAFFNGGVLNSCALLLEGYQYNKSKKNVHLVKIIILCILGMFIARTTIIGILLSLPLITNYKTLKKLLKSLVLMFPLIALGVIQLFRFNPKMTKWAMEIFINLSEGKVQTSSTNILLRFLKIVPDNYKTFLIGDGLFSGEKGYYMGTDVGYMRIIFYGGILALSFLLLYKYCLYFFASEYEKTKAFKLFLVMYLLLDIILNVKGLTMVTILPYIFIFLHRFDENKKLEEG